MAKRDDYKVIAVFWRDASIHTTWTEEPQAKGLTEVISVGFLTSEDDQVVRLALSRTREDWGDIMVIPKSQIVKRKMIHRITVLGG